MQTKDVALMLLLVFFVFSVLEVWKDPYYHRETVNFWEWARRELAEALSYERA